MDAGQGEVLLQLARAAIAHSFGGPKVQKPAGAEWLDVPGATFVSLHQDGDLRGCVGNLRPSGTLFDSVVRNARR